MFCWEYFKNQECFMILILAISTCKIEQECNLNNPVIIQVVGESYEWKYLFKDIDNKFDSGDELFYRNSLHLPANTNVQLEIISKDFLYFFSIPELRLIETAMPDKTYFLNFKTPNPQTLSIEGDQMCGYNHESLSGELVIESPYLFCRWLKKQTTN